MKIVHLSDLHLGKRVNEFSMIEDQQYILKEIIEIIKNENANAVIIAGDVYDKPTPPVEAVQLFDNFLNELAVLKIPSFVISGNHDSAERMSFGSRLMTTSGIYFSPVYNGEAEKVTLKDEFGNVNFYLLPFVKPVVIRRYFEGKIDSYTDAVNAAVKKMNIDETERNVIISHQFVTGATRCESEEISIGGLDNVDSFVFDGFDYVALGHIHGPQKILRETVRYSGTPLKYSFSEINHKKSVCVVEMNEKGNTKINLVPLKPLRDMREIKGYFYDVMDAAKADKNTQDYVHVILTDEDEIPEVVSKIREIYPNVMKVNYDNKRTQQSQTIVRLEEIEKMSPLELFSELYEKQNNQKMSKDQTDFMVNIIDEIWGKK